MTLAETKAELGHVQAQQKIHELECICRHAVGKRPPCADRSNLAAEARRLRREIKTWFAMPEDAESLF